MSGSTKKFNSVIFEEQPEQVEPNDAAPFSKQFTDNDEATIAARATYFKILGTSAVLISLAIFAVFSMFWGSLWKVPARHVRGWIVDFDGGELGQVVIQGLQNQPSNIDWVIRDPSEFSNELGGLATAVGEERCWVAVSINSGATRNLSSAVSTTDSSYDGSHAVTVFADEARNENAYRLLITTGVQPSLQATNERFALRFIQDLASSAPSNITSLLTNAPQIVAKPLSYQLVNIRPFNVPVATAAVFVGLIDITILSFFIVMTGSAAREISGLNQLLTYSSLIRLRMISTVIIYFFLSLFYSLLSVVFRMPYTAKFGQSGFLVLWMVNWLGMLALGLALEAMITWMTVNFIPFFLLIWMTANISVALWPIDLLPAVFRYGYAVPFYNMYRAMRTVFFGTKNNVGLNLGVLIVWIIISCVTLPLFQWLVRRSQIKAYKSTQSTSSQRDLS
ncbi:hypothetical protein ONZ45_g8039 [Pleurotus djamor]|nr:hypothetical protein ONZ45_g8039 [Pleurotus djamor]